MQIVSKSRFSRDLIMDMRRDIKDRNLRKQRTNELYKKFGVVEVWFMGKLIGWQEKDQFHCYKKAFATERDARMILDITSIRRRGNLKAHDVYQCPKCNMWHATSQGHLAGTYKA